MAAASKPTPAGAPTLGDDERTSGVEQIDADAFGWDEGSGTGELKGSTAAVHHEEARPGRRLARRYQLVERLGEGAHGEVWTADDLVLHELVALKWMRRAAGRFPARIRREITTLRMLREPGVVRLLDDGVEDGLPFLVMERVEGKPFPGGAPSCDGARPRWTWDTIAEPALLLLEVLSRVHAAGVIHRDLKPDNILVSAAGRPTMLDFGVSRWHDPTDRLGEIGQIMGAPRSPAPEHALTDRLTDVGQIMGTPRYLAPEQIRGGVVDARTDLYAVGVMLYEALTGWRPHEAPDVMSLLRARLDKPALPVREIASDVPATVAAVIDRLLERRIERRFRSAGEVLSALRGERIGARTAPALPRLGHRRALNAVLDAAASGRSIDVVGVAGSGRTRCLEDAAEALAQEGRSVVWTRPACVLLETALRSALAAGAVVLADDADRLDPRSAAMLDRCRAAPGTIVRALTATPDSAPAEALARLDLLDEASLRPLFAGPDRLFHLREDAAAALWRRTLGLPARIEAEVLRWTRLGLARWDGALLVVDREALGRLNVGLFGAAHAQASPEEVSSQPHLEELLRWLALGGRHLGLDELAQAMGRSVERVEAECDALLACGAARREQGHVLPRGHVDLSWPTDKCLEVHRAIARALRPGQDGRLFHLVAAEEAMAAAVEAVEVARLRARAGDLGAAVTALVEGLRAVRHQDEAEAGGACRLGSAEVGDREFRILSIWVKVAFANATPYALDRVLYELSRARRGPEVERLATLVRAGLGARGASGAQALELAESLGPFEDPELERWRQRVRVMFASTRPSPALLAKVLEGMAAWSEPTNNPVTRLSRLEGEAVLRYAQGRFDEAAALHAAAADREPWITGRIDAIVRSAAALLEAFRHREAAERAATARELAARCRHAYWEGRAEWLLRAARYRMGEVGAPDLELVEAVARVGARVLEAPVCLNEAAIAFRAGEEAVGAALSRRATEVWKGLNHPWGALLSRCLSLACGERAHEGEVRALAEQAMECPLPGIGVQALGLLGRVFPEARGVFRHAVGALAETVPRAHWGERIEVLSVEEALEGVLGEGDQGGSSG